MDLSQFSDEELNQMLAPEGVDMSSYSDEQLSSMEAELTPQDLFSRIGRDIESRGQDVADIQQMHQQGMISKPVEMAMMAGKGGAGLIGDISGELLKSGLDVAAGVDEYTGGYVGAGLSGIGGAIGSLPSISGGTIGERLPQEIAQVGEAYGGFAEEHPIISTGLEAGANMAMLVPALKYGEDIIDAAGNIRKGLSKSKIAKMSSDDVRKQASDLFQQADDVGGQLKPEFMDDFIDDINKLNPQTEIGMALKGEDDVTTIINTLTQIKGQPLTLRGMQEADEIIGNLAYKHTDDFGKLNNEGRLLMEIQSTLRDKIENAPMELFMSKRGGFDIIKEARKFWSASLRLQDVEKILQKAEGAAQPSTIIKNGFRRLRDNKKRFKSYTPQEQFAIKKAAKDGAVGSFLKMGASGLVPLIAGGAGMASTGSAAGGLASIPAYLLQQGAKTASSGLQAGRGKAVEEAIKRGIMPNVPRDPLLRPMLDLSTSLGQSTRPIAAMNALTQETPQNNGLSDRARAFLDRKRAAREGNK